MPASVQHALRAPGRPLDSGMRGFMESRFGHDFSGVRLHTDSRSAQSARDISALAYTYGSDIVFGEGQFAPDTGSGQRLLAHELAHVVQQQGSNPTLAPQGLGPADSAQEREADTAAAAVLTGRAPSVASGARRLIQRSTPSGYELSDAELLALADLAPIRVEGISDKRLEEVLIAANNGLIDIVTPGEFERQLRFRVERRGSADFADFWTDDERWEYAQAQPGDQKAQLAAKWVSFIGQRYMAYLADKAAQWHSATSRMHTAAVIGEVIGQVTVTAATLFIGGGGVGATRAGGGAAVARETTKTVLKREVEAVARNRAAEFADKAIRLAAKVVPSPDTDQDKKKRKRDTCQTLWGLNPGENARVFEQRAPIRGETTVDHVRFRLDRGIPPPRGGDTTEGSRAWIRRIGCPSDDAGHVLANRFGGFAFYNSQFGNIFPQDLTFNRGQMNRVDEAVAGLHERGADVCVLIQLSYEPADSLRPTHAAYFIRARWPGAFDFVPVRDIPIRNESRDEGCEA